MLINKSRITAFLILMMFTGIATQLTAGPGTTSGQFLNVPVHSRELSLAGSCVAMTKGAGALYYNPAGLGLSAGGEFSFSHSELYQDLKLDNVSMAVRLNERAGIGFGATYVGYGDIHGFDADGNSTGELSAYSMALSVGLSWRVSDIFAVGAVAKPVFEKLDSYSAQTVTLDLGVVADFGRLSVGLQGANLCGSLTYLTEANPLPRVIRLGVAYHELGAGSTVSLAGSRESSGLYRVLTGLEYQYSSSLVFRVGYDNSLTNQVDASEGVSAGVGIILNPVSLDYSYHPGGALDGIHHITISYQFDK